MRAVSSLESTSQLATNDASGSRKTACKLHNLAGAALLARDIYSRRLTSVNNDRMTAQDRLLSSLFSLTRPCNAAEKRSPPQGYPPLCCCTAIPVQQAFVVREKWEDEEEEETLAYVPLSTLPVRYSCVQLLICIQASHS